MRLKIAAVVAAICLSSLPAFAQQQTPQQQQQQNATTGTSAANPPAVTDKVAVPIWPVTTVKLPDVQPVEASFSLGKIEGVAPELVTGVTAKGYTRKVDVQNQSIGQILVVSVAKGQREETISAEGLQAQFDAKQTDSLFPEKTVEVSGSKAALVAALERLAAPKEEKDKKETKDDVSQNPVSSGKTSNDEASSYRSPTVTSAAPETKDPVTDLRSTTNDCPVRIDLAQGVAIQQSKVQTFTDGALTNDGSCTDSEVSYKLKKSYPSCPTDIVDMDAMKAWPQFQWYYVDDAAGNHPIGECQKDEETAYTITEDEKQCPVSIDFLEQKAIPQSAFVYIGRNNALTQVPGKGCAASTKTAAVPLVENKAACPMRHDYTNNLTHELSMWTYVLGGVTYQAAPCADTGRTFVQDLIYTDATGAYICPVITNMTTKKATLQYRRRITVDGTPQFITDCTPDTSTQDILSTSAPCMDPSTWTHDLDANISYGQERFYYKRQDGTPEYVTACQTSTVTYPHDVKVTGYQNHDDQLWAYPLSTVTITVSGKPYTVASSVVLPGAAQWSYILEGTVDQKTGKTTYEPPPSGCKAYRETATYERWTRPDETEYLKQVGTGTPEIVSDVCVTTTIKSAQVNLSNWCSLGTVPTWGANYHTINKNEKKNTETGVVVSTICVEASVSSSQTGTVTYNGDVYQACDSGIIPDSSRISWNPWGGTRYASQSSPWPGYTAVFGTTCPSGF